MENQIISAVEIAYDPHHPAYADALRFVTTVRDDPSAWTPCLAIFLKLPPQPEAVRVFCLSVVNSAIERGRLDQPTIYVVKNQLLSYVKEIVVASADDSNGALKASVENKLVQTLTLCLVGSRDPEWISCFDDMIALTSTHEGPWTNLKGVVFYLRFLNAIHDEVGDQLVERSSVQQDRANAIKDQIRLHDMQKVSLSWQEILRRSGPTGNYNADIVIELCFKAIGRWVSWIDISLVVNQQMLQLFFSQLELAQRTDLSPGAENARDAAIHVFIEIVGKKMPAADKLQVIIFLRLHDVITQLNTCPPLAEPRKSTYNVDLAESVSKLVNASVLEIIKVLSSEGPSTDSWRKADDLIRTFLPHLLRYFSDEYDEVCSTVIPAMTELLTFLQHSMAGPEQSSQRAVMLLPIVRAIFAKMRYDETSDWGEDDQETDEAEFQDLRRRLGVLQQSVAKIDEQIYTDALTGLVTGTFTQLRAQTNSLNWRDLDLALHEMFLFGELAAKSGGLYRKNKPNTSAADKLVQMMTLMLDSGTTSYDHPAIQMQLMEISVRYSSFFQKHQQYIDGMLETFVRLAHSSNAKIKLRAWYLTLRYVRDLRLHLSSSASILLRSITDLLMVKAELPEQADMDEMSSDDGTHVDSVFDTQLYLFEAAGCICGIPSIGSEEQVASLHSVSQPLVESIRRRLETGRTLTPLDSVQLHHDLVALGTVARGYSDWLRSNASSQTEMNLAVRAEFVRIEEATLLALKTFGTSREIREAANHNFTRLVGIIGGPMLTKLPEWVEGLLIPSATPNEVAEVLRMLGQIVFMFKGTGAVYLEALLTPLLQRVITGLSVKPEGTDEANVLMDLKRDYLEFLVAILANDLSDIIVSDKNQPFFDTIIGTLEHFGRDPTDLRTAKTALQVLNRMASIWGGHGVAEVQNQVNGNGVTSQKALPGFDEFMMTRFSPVTWALATEPSFNPRDAQARSVLSEAASLQLSIYDKTGDKYLVWLRDNELKRMGMEQNMINSYLSNLSELDIKAFRAYFAQLVTQTRGV